VRDLGDWSFALLAIAAAIAGCAGSGSPQPVPRLASPLHRAMEPPAGLIQHVVILIQENRSFDDLFNGYPGADTVSVGSIHGSPVPLQQMPLEAPGDPSHSHGAFMLDLDGGAMDGFDDEAWPRSMMPPNAPYSVVPQSETAPLWSIAQQYVIADRMFASNSGPSYPAHQYLIAGESAMADENPDSLVAWGCDSPPRVTVRLLDAHGKEVPGPFPCFDYATLADEMSARSVGWNFYTGKMLSIWNAFDAISHIRYGPAWTTNFRTPPSAFMTDVHAGILAPVTWITPVNENSDHPNNLHNTGPGWVASVVNAVGRSKFWKSTAIFVVWDDWGGWYDHVAPQAEDVMGLGFRVPMLVVSPYSRHGYVSHDQHEFGSLLKFTEEAFSLPSLGTTDARSDDLADCFDFTQSPAPFAPIQHALPLAQIRQIELTATQPPDY
jgi:phospholipase C